jgi:predicted ATPase/DNA-binding SARP family transcriptional activator
MPVLTLQLFGSPQIIYDQEWIDMRSVKACALLFYLAVTQRSHSRLALAGLLWPDKNDAEARTNLRQAIYHLHLVIPDCLFATRDSVKLNPQFVVAVDVLRFEEQVLFGLKSDRADNALRTAVALYQGDFLSGLFVDDASPYEEWMLDARERLNKLAFEAFRRLTDMAIVQQDRFEGLRYAQQLVALDPLNEDSHYQTMQLLVMNGQTQAALAQYEECKRLLTEQLGVQPSEKLKLLARDIRRGVGQIPAVVRAQIEKPNPRMAVSSASGGNERVPPHNLNTPLSSFVGRQRELAALQQILATPSQRLVTLVGTGGVGKTRLANHLGNLLLPDFEDGVWFVDLLAIGDEAMVEQTVLSALGINEKGQRTPAESLVFHLATKQILLLFDNCEHVIETTARLIDLLLQAAPRLKIVATSREPLNIPGEHCFSVSPLGLPKTQAAHSVQEILASESVQLFVQRASFNAGGAESALALNDVNARSVAHVCRMLDGIPLAIELVAARTRTLSVTQIAHQLEQVPGATFHLTNRGGRNAHARHQTLHSSIEWSYRLLTPGERKLFDQLAVFAGSWSLAAAREICGSADNGPADKVSESSVLDGLTSLVDKSLIIAEPNGDEMRYRFLETIQRFALDKLTQSGEESQIRDRHLRYFVRFMERWELPPAGMPRALWQSIILPDLDNIRGALSWSWQSGAARSGLRLAEVTGEFWFSQGFHSESIHWIQSLLAMPEAAQEKKLRLTLLSAMEFTHWWVLGNYAKAKELQLEALTLALELGDTQRIEKTLNNLGGVALRTGDYVEASTYLGQSLARTAKSGNKLNRAWSSILLGEAMLAQNQVEASIPYFEEAVQLLRILQTRSLLAYPIRRLGQIAFLQQQDIPRALDYYRESLELNLAAGEVEGKAACVAAYANLFYHLGACERAILLCAAVVTTLDLTQSRLSAYDLQAFDDLLATLQKRNLPNFDETWLAGTKLSLQQTIDAIELWLAEMRIERG